jgi:two-component system KDP operon response regulator KdpE
VSARVLLIDDSETERAVVKERLERAGFTVWTATDGNDGLRRLYDVRPDLVLLDLVMPKRDGWETLELIRQVSDVPVIMLTGSDTEIERVRGLRGGADDYVGKPYSAPELLARIEAVLRRTGGKPTVKEVWDDGVVRIDYGAGEVTVRGRSVSLTPLEFRLLSTLVEHAGLVLSRDQLLEHVWGDAHSRAGDKVKLYVGYLRRKIERDPREPELVETVRGFGYRYVKR